VSSADASSAVTRYVRRRERRDGETLLAKLLATLVGLCLMRVVCESELDEVLEYDRGALAKMVEQRRGRTECGRERIGAWDGAPLAQPSTSAVYGWSSSSSSRGPSQPSAARRSARAARRRASTRVAGRTSTASTASCERCVTGSNLRSVSMSSPKSSMRIGMSADAGYTSMIPPRREKRARLADLGDRLVAELEEPRRRGVPRHTIAGTQRPPRSRRCSGAIVCCIKRTQRRDDRDGLGRVCARQSVRRR
jgi:hypothetical protein